MQICCKGWVTWLYIHSHAHDLEICHVDECHYATLAIHDCMHTCVSPGGALTWLHSAPYPGCSLKNNNNKQTNKQTNKTKNKNKNISPTNDLGTRLGYTVNNIVVCCQIKFMPLWFYLCVMYIILYNLCCQRVIKWTSIFHKLWCIIGFCLKLRHCLQCESFLL